MAEEQRRGTLRIWTFAWVVCFNMQNVHVDVGIGAYFFGRLRVAEAGGLESAGSCAMC